MCFFVCIDMCVCALVCVCVVCACACACVCVCVCVCVCKHSSMPPNVVNILLITRCHIVLGESILSKASQQFVLIEIKYMVEMCKSTIDVRYIFIFTTVDTHQAHRTKQ